MDKLIYLDVETTGLYAWKHGIIQLAAIVEIDGEIFEFNEHCKPFPGDEIDGRALQANGISEAMIQSFQPAEEAFAKFVAFLKRFVNKYEKGDKMHLYGYNVSFDEEFLRAWFKKNNDKYFGSWFWTPSICVMRMLAEHVRSQRAYLPNFKLTTLTQALEIEVEGLGAHDALYDIHATRKLHKLCDARTIRD